MKKTAHTILESVADKLGDTVIHTFLKELEEMPDKRLGYDYDSYMLAFLPFEEISTNLAESFVQGLVMENEWNMNPDEQWKIVFVYQHYDFVNAQVEELIERYEGSVCSHDKSSTLIAMYNRYLATNELPDVTKGEKEFWKPQLGTAEEWMNFIDSTRYLHRGKPELYLKAYQQLVDRYEKWVEEKRAFNENLLETSPYFVGKTPVGEDMEFTFEAEGDVKATIIFKPQQHLKYRYSEPAMELLNRKEKYHFERQPWFNELIGKLK